MGNEDDLRRKALSAFREHLEGEGTDGPAPASGGGGNEGGEPPEQSAETTVRNPASSSKVLRRKTAGSASLRRVPRKGAPSKTQKAHPSPAATAGPSASGTHHDSLPSGRRAKTERQGGNGLLWMLLILQFLVLIACVILVIGMTRLARAVQALQAGFASQAKALQAVTRDAAEARVNSQVKFGVYRNAKGELRGVVLNYKRPERMKDVPLK